MHQKSILKSQQSRRSLVSTYTPEVLNACQGTEGAAILLISSVQEQVTHHLGVVVHRGACHAKRD